MLKILINNKILFIPDCNLGAWVEEQVPEKTFKFVHGGCPTHLRMSIADVERAKAAHPAAKLLVHPECLAEFPCNECAKAIIQSGIREVVYDCDKYEGTASVTASKRMLRAAGVTIRRYEHTGREVTLVL